MRYHCRFAQMFFAISFHVFFFTSRYITSTCDRIEHFNTVALSDDLCSSFACPTYSSSYFQGFCKQKSESKIFISCTIFIKTTYRLQFYLESQSFRSQVNHGGANVLKCSVNIFGYGFYYPKQIGNLRLLGDVSWIKSWLGNQG